MCFARSKTRVSFLFWKFDFSRASIGSSFYLGQNKLIAHEHFSIIIRTTGTTKIMPGTKTIGQRRRPLWLFILCVIVSAWTTTARTLNGLEESGHRSHADGRQRSIASNPTEDVLHHSQPVKVRSQNAHPDAHVDGFTVHSFFTNHLHPVTNKHIVTHVEIKPNEGLEEKLVKRRRKLLYDPVGTSTQATATNERPFNETNVWYKDTFHSEEKITLDASNSRSRKKVRALAKLNFIGNDMDADQDDIWRTSADQEEIIAKTGELEFTSADDKVYFSQQCKSIINFLKAEINSMGASVEHFNGPQGDLATDFETGVGINAILFTNGIDHILTFRGTSTLGDNQNIESWIIGSFVYGDKGRPEPNGTDPKVSVNSGMSGMMYRNWIQAGLNWTDEMTTRSEEDTSVQKVYLGAGMTIRGTWVLSTLSGNRGSSNTATGDAFEVSLANNVDGRPIGTTNKTGHLTIEEAYLAGYWPVTKQVIDAVRVNVMGLSTGSTTNNRLLFSGYSQGGGRAQLARMYTEKVHLEKWPTITFGGVGAACFPRDLRGPGRTNLLNDVDPTKFYEDVIDYEHYLDPWGASLGQDIGTTCKYGKIGLLQSRAYKYCSAIWGYPAAVLVAETEIGKTLILEGKVQDNFRLCRHFAHGLTSIVRNLMSDDELNEDGTTSGGCTNYEGWPLGDTRCPVTDDSVFYWILAVAISVPVGFILILCLICRCCRCCCFKKKGCCCRPYEKTDQNDQLKV